MPGIYPQIAILKVRTYKKRPHQGPLFPSQIDPIPEISTENPPQNHNLSHEINNIPTKTPGIGKSVTGIPFNRINNLPTEMTGVVNAFLIQVPCAHKGTWESRAKHASTGD
jgi:hypothetical protein